MKREIGVDLWQKLERHNPVVHGLIEKAIRKREKLTKSLVLSLKTRIKLELGIKNTDKIKNNLGTNGGKV